MRCKLCGNQKLIKLCSININDLKAGYHFDISKYFTSQYINHYMCSNCQLKQFDNAISGDAEFYDNIQEKPFYYEIDKPEFTKAIEYICKYKPHKILEIGAGKGFFLEKLKDFYFVRASEMSQKSINYLLNKGIQLDQDNEKYDFIFAFQVMEHVENILEFLNFIDTKLYSGGYVFITVPNNDSDYFKEVFDILDYPPHHMYQFNEFALKYITNILNYELVEYWTEPMRIIHYSILIRHRRRKIMQKFPFRFLWKILSLLDFLLVPYYYDNKSKGHTHGILLKKP